jgi:hypothetical protein
MTSIFLSTWAAAIIPTFLSYVVVGSSLPTSGHGNETDAPAWYFSRGPFADDPAGSELSASAGLLNRHHYTQPLYRIDSVEDFHRLAEGVNEHIRAEAAKLEECQRGMRELGKVCYPSITSVFCIQQPNIGGQG